MTTPFTTALKIIKYLAINLTKHVKVSHAENNKSLIKVIKENINRQKKHPVFMDSKP